MDDLPPAKLPLPKFASEKEAAEYWDTHSVAEIWDQLQPARPIKLPPEQRKAIRQRYYRRTQAISLRLDRRQILEAKRIAKRKSLAYQTQLRLWIAEGIERDGKTR